MKAIVLSFPLLLAFLLPTGDAHADVPSRDKSDRKSVVYTFSLHGLPSDRVVLADLSASGAGIQRVEEGVPLRVNTTSRPSIHMTTVSYWAGNGLSDTLECAGAPTPVTHVDDDDDRDELHEDLDFSATSATSCTVTSRGVPQSSSGGCNVSGSTSLPVALLLGIPTAMLLLGKRRRAAT